MSDHSNSNDNQNNQQSGIPQHDPQTNQMNVKPYEQHGDPHANVNQSHNYEPYQSQSNSPLVNQQQQPFNQPTAQQQHMQQQQQQPPYNQQPPYQNQGGYYNQPPQYGYPNYQQPGMPLPPNYVSVKTNTKAIVALVLGILAVISPAVGLLIGIAGIIVSALAMKEVSRKQESGSGLAIAGLVCSILGFLFWAMFLLPFVITLIALGMGLTDVNNAQYYS